MASDYLFPTNGVSFGRISTCQMSFSFQLDFTYARKGTFEINYAPIKMSSFNTSQTLGVEDNEERRLAKVFESHSKYQHTNVTATTQYL